MFGFYIRKYFHKIFQIFYNFNLNRNIVYFKFQSISMLSLQKLVCIKLEHLHLLFSKCWNSGNSFPFSKKL